MSNFKCTFNKMTFFIGTFTKTLKYKFPPLEKDVQDLDDKQRKFK